MCIHTTEIYWESRKSNYKGMFIRLLWYSSAEILSCACPQKNWYLQLKITNMDDWFFKMWLESDYNDLCSVKSEVSRRHKRANVQGLYMICFKHLLALARKLSCNNRPLSSHKTILCLKAQREICPMTRDTDELSKFQSSKKGTLALLYGLTWDGGSTQHAIQCSITVKSTNILKPYPQYYSLD